jgi:uncharacterized protein (TIGR02118 family)
MPLLGRPLPALRSPHYRHRMVVTLLGLYGQPADPASWDQRYTEEHLPLAAAIPGLRAQRAARVQSTAEGSDSPYYLVGELVFDDVEAMQAGASSPEGQAAVTNFAELAPPGSLLLVMEETLDRTF